MEENKVTANKDIILKNEEGHEILVDKPKEELLIISIEEAITRDNIDTEILNKIRFFITNGYINLYSYKVNIKSGMFYNIETNEAFEVRKNKVTNEYEIYKGGELVYGNNQQLEEKTNEEISGETPLEENKEEEEQLYEPRLIKPKARVLRPMNNNRAAFIKSGYLIISVITFIILTIMIILLNK